MKTKNRVLSFFLALLIFVSTFVAFQPIEVSATEIVDDIPKLTAPSVGTLKYLTSVSKYAYAKENITPESSFKLKWDDVADYYTVYVKALKNDPNPGEEEPGELLYNKQADDGFSDNYLTISKLYLEDCVDKYLKVSIQGKNSNGSNTARCDYYIYVSEGPKKDPEADLYVYPSEIELGESFEYEGTACGNDYTLNTVTVGFTYYGSEYNYANDIATDTGYLRYTGLSTDKYDVYKEIQTGSNSYLTCTDETGKITKQFYWGYTGIYTITLYAGSNEYYNEYEENVKTKKRIDVVKPSPEIIDITAASSSVRVAEDLIFTVTTNGKVEGIAFFVDSTDNYIGSIQNAYGKQTHSFTYRFNKTSKEDSNGNDISNKRTIYVYPIDEDGDILLNEGLVYCSITVNPAKYNFDNFEVNSAQTTDGKAVTITWDVVTAKNGATVCYNLWIDDELIAENLSQNSYTLMAKQIKELGVGTYGTMVMATASQHRQKQATSSLTIHTDGYVIVYPGDVNGDGTIDATDVTRLKKYLANYDETDPAKQSVVDPIGADVNGDGKINGKDLVALYVKLENEDIEIPAPEPEPDFPSTLPAVKHTYTVRIPLDKADLKATTGRTIDVMPNNGYVKLVAYDETGKEVKLSQAGITVDISSANGVVTFDGYTLKAVKGGYGVISYTQTVNGKKTTTEIAIHVGEARAPISAWPSAYQYAEEDYAYVSMCLDLNFSIHKANMPTEYADIDLSMGEIILDSCANLSEYLASIIKADFGVSVNTIKKSLSSFIVDYSEYLASDDVIMGKANSFSKAFGSFVEVVDTSSSTFKDVCDLLNVDFAVLAQSIKLLKENKAISDVDLKTLLQFIRKLEQDQVIDIIPSASTYLKGLKELGFSWDAFKLTCDKARGFLNKDIGKRLTKLSQDKFFYLGLTLEAIESLLYMSVDYTESINVLEKLRSQLVKYYTADSIEIQAIDKLIFEFKYDYIEAYRNLKAGGTVIVLMSLGHPVVSIGSFAASILSGIMGISEKRDISILTFYVCALNKTLISYMDMYKYGEMTSQYDDLKFSTSMYLNLIYRQNDLAKSIAKDSGDEAKFDVELKEIERVFGSYLKYK